MTESTSQVGDTVRITEDFQGHARHWVGQIGRLRRANPYSAYPYEVALSDGRSCPVKIEEVEVVDTPRNAAEANSLVELLNEVALHCLGYTPDVYDVDAHAEVMQWLREHERWQREANNFRADALSMLDGTPVSTLPTRSASRDIYQRILDLLKVREDGLDEPLSGTITITPGSEIRISGLTIKAEA